MNFFIRCRRVIVWAMLLPLLALVVDSSTLARAMVSPQEGLKVKNVEWRIEGEIVYIMYDLVGSPDIECEVSVVLLREGFPDFRVVPQTVSGHVGKGKFVGERRQIRWDFKMDVPGGLEGEDYYFEIVIKEVTASNTWLYLSVGAAAVVGGALFLLKGKSTAGGTSTPAELPGPPARP